MRKCIIHVFERSKIWFRVKECAQGHPACPWRRLYSNPSLTTKLSSSASVLCEVCLAWAILSEINQVKRINSWVFKADNRVLQCHDFYEPPLSSSWSWCSKWHHHFQLWEESVLYHNLVWPQNHSSCSATDKGCWGSGNFFAFCAPRTIVEILWLGISMGGGKF